MPTFLPPIAPPLTFRTNRRTACPRSNPHGSLPRAILACGLTLGVLLTYPAGPASAQDAAPRPQQAQDAAPQRAAPQDPGGQQATPQAATPQAAAGGENAAPAVQISQEVRDAVAPMVRRIAAAETLRVTARMTVASAVGDEVLGTTEGLFQIASATPNRLALSAKFQDEAVRFVSNGENLYVQISPEAYVETEAPESFAALASGMPVQLGPQPEPMLWLSLAGVDPSMSLIDGVVSMEVAGKEAVNGVDAVQVRGVRREGIVWTLSVATGDNPRPLALHIDMTEMITRANSLDVPEGYSFSIRYDFQRWEPGATLDDQLFKYEPPAGAERFDSIADYLLQASDVGAHPLLGQPAPELQAKTLEGESVSVGGETDQVVVLEFWATWCAPCVEAMPKMAEIAKQFQGKNVRFYAVNVSEEREVVENFLKEREQELGMPVVLDPEGEIASAYAATAIPQTVLIGKGGRVEAVHVGFDFDESPELLQQELETLLAGRRIYEAEEVVEPSEGADAESAGEDSPPAAQRD